MIVEKSFTKGVRLGLTYIKTTGCPTKHDSW